MRRHLQSLSGRLTYLAGANSQRLALSPLLSGHWSSTGLSTLVAAHLIAGALALVVYWLVAGLLESNWAAVAGLLAYTLGLRDALSWLLKLLRQCDRPGPDRTLGRWLLLGLLAGALVGVALLLAAPYERLLTGTYPHLSWQTYVVGPTALLRWAARGIVLAVLAVPLAARLTLARRSAYGTLCRTDYLLNQLHTRRTNTTR